ncbi:lysozyme [Pectobacterium brasiliense]|uniref:lysozyme n=1 Tax=Pectobacterium brasiliense TaxID=180957 RepID=UPI0001A42727|nr:lysozyme [Pectobacterium brasiliense]KGA24915.1 lysozyme [Pectobacterium brasiliense]KRF62852.1 lysozyme [Pectobacterium brasiliense]MBN3186061.1 lysozyme [Pectobacterium brasiliense]QHG26893.1 glycoside hydrolase family protein [Pectobacterium brasiliense]
MNSSLRKKIAGAAAGGAIAIATVLIQWHEGRSYTVYYDVAGVPTVCDGITGQDVKIGKTYTATECDALLVKHIAPAATAVDKAVKVPMTDMRKAALISFTYNIGIGALNRSTMLRKLNAGDTSEACDELKRWDKAGGKVWRGLTDRRAVERELCLSGLQ